MHTIGLTGINTQVSGISNHNYTFLYSTGLSPVLTIRTQPMLRLNRAIIAIERVECKSSFCLDCLKVDLLTIFINQEQYIDTLHFDTI